MRAGVLALTLLLLSARGGVGRMADPAVSRGHVRRRHHVRRSGSMRRAARTSSSASTGRCSVTCSGSRWTSAAHRASSSRAISSLVQRSSVTTLTGNVIIALPRHLTEYTLGPYFVARRGADARTHRRSLRRAAGCEHAARDGHRRRGHWFLSKRIGLNWEARYFRSVGGKELRGFSFGTEQLSFWRASMGLVIRY